MEKTEPTQADRVAKMHEIVAYIVLFYDLSTCTPADAVDYYFSGHPRPAWFDSHARALIVDWVCEKAR